MGVDQELLTSFFQEERLRTEFGASEPVTNLINQHYERGEQLHEARDRLSKALFFLSDPTPWHGPMFRQRSTRPKSVPSIVRKLFQRVKKSVGPNFEELRELTDEDLLLECYHGIHDLIGGRICVVYCDEVEDAVEVLVYKLNKRGFPKARVADDNYLLGDKKGYRGYHFHVNIPSGRDVFVAEIQVRTLLDHAWAEMCHQLVYHPAITKPGGIPAPILGETSDLSCWLANCNQRFVSLRDQVYDWHTSGIQGAVR